MLSATGLQLIATDAPFRAVPGKALIAQIDDKTIVIDFPKPVAQFPGAAARNRKRLFAKVYSCSIVALMSASAIVASYSLLTLQH